MSEVNGAIRTDKYGVMRVGSTRISLDSVVVAFQQGHSPTTIHEQYPGLTQDQVNQAIDYYLAHRSEVDDYLVQQAEVWRKLRAEFEQNAPPVVERLRAMRHSAEKP